MEYLTYATITHWKHLGLEGTISFSAGVNLLIGKNGSGKTTILNMLDAACKATGQGKLFPKAAKLDENAELVKLVFGNPPGINVMRNVKKSDQGNWEHSPWPTDVLRFITSQRSITKGVTPQLLSQAAASREGEMPPTDQSVDIAGEFNRLINDEIRKRLIELAKNPDFLEDLQKEYQEELIDFEKDLKIDLDREGDQIFFADQQGNEVPVGGLSSGEKEYLYFYSVLRRMQKHEKKIILIDEPELHLHSTQIRKLCGLIAEIGQKNQVILATHSGEILQYFITRANLILLSKGKASNITEVKELKDALQEIGLPIDPSVFTAHWICAENHPFAPIGGGENAPTTPELLSWIFGTSVENRYWSFGSNTQVADALIEGISVTLAERASIDLTVFLDGDRLVYGHESYPPSTIPNKDNSKRYLPFWEIENLFFAPAILNEVIPGKEGENGVTQFWGLIEKNKEALENSIKKTIAKNQIRKLSPDRSIKNGEDIEVSIQSWKESVGATELNLAAIEPKFQSIVEQRDWKWLPGKEVLRDILLPLIPDFWLKIRKIQKDKKLSPIIKEVLSL